MRRSCSTPSPAAAPKTVHGTWRAATRLSSARRDYAEITPRLCRDYAEITPRSRLPAQRSGDVIAIAKHPRVSVVSRHAEGHLHRGRACEITPNVISNGRAPSAPPRPAARAAAAWRWVASVPPTPSGRAPSSSVHEWCSSRIASCEGRHAGVVAAVGVGMGWDGRGWRMGWDGWDLREWCVSRARRRRHQLLEESCAQQQQQSLHSVPRIKSQQEHL